LCWLGFGLLAVYMQHDVITLTSTTASCCVLGAGWKWLLNFYRLVLYAMLLLPGFMQVRLSRAMQH